MFGVSPPSLRVKPCQASSGRSQESPACHPEQSERSTHLLCPEQTPQILRVAQEDSSRRSIGTAFVP